MSKSCRICGTKEGRRWKPREMMIGLGEVFDYFECGGCGCLQIVTIPEDLHRFYPSSYYSFTQAATPIGIKGWLRCERNRRLLTGSGLIGLVLNPLTRYPYEGVGFWFRRNRHGTAARVLDIGCGSGTLINDLASVGYRNPLGVDPFVPGPIHYPSGARVLRGEIEDVNGTFDLVLMNHVLEHLPDPVRALSAVRHLLADHGECLVRTPTVTSFAWEHYREDWVQLDAPRHLVIHSVESLRLAAQAAGLSLSEVRYDSAELQFTGSEAYRKGITGMEGRKNYSRDQMRQFRRRARELNRQMRGDQAAFVLRRA